MIFFDGFTLDKYPLFDHASWKFYKGVTFLLGRNKHRRDPNASNASGKSVLMGALPSALFDTHSVVTKGARSVQKKMYQKDTVVSVQLRRDDVKYEYRKHNSKVSLLCNGEDLYSRVGRQSLEKLLNITEDEFFSTIYVDGRRTNTFLLGTASDRLSFITSLFRLHDMDELRRMFGRQVQELRDRSGTHENVLLQIQDTEKLLSSFPADLTEQVSTLKALRDELQDRVQKNQSIVHQHAAAESYQKAKEQRDAIIKPSISKKDAAVGLKEHQRYEAALDVWTAQRAKRKRTQALVDELQRRVGKRVATYEKAVNLRAKTETLACEKPETVEDPKSTEIDVQATRDALAVATSEQRQLRENLRKLGALKKHTCPTCLQSIDRSVVKSMVAKLKSDIASIDKAIAKHETRLEIAQRQKAYTEYTEQLARWSKYQRYKEAVGDYPFADVEKLIRLREVLQEKATRKPEMPTVHKDACVKALAVYERIEHAEALLRNLQPVELPARSKDHALQQLEKVNRLLRNVNDKLPELQGKLELREHHRKQLKSLRKQRDEAAVGLEDLPVYELLHKAYSAQGIKQLITASLCKTLEKNINSYAKHVFEEGFKFHIDVSGAKFDFMVTRRNGTACDVRYFSGAESRLFAVVFLLSLLPMIPASRRANILILDEPTANMDQPLVDTFRDVLLPKLARIVPSLVIVTPDHTLVPQGARVFTVVKERGKSSLHSGIV